MNSRIEKVCKNMKLQGFDQLVVTQPEALNYLIGYYELPHERLCALLIDADGGLRLFANIVFSLPDGLGIPMFLHSDVDDQTAALAEALHGVVGIDETFPARFLLPLIEKCGDVTFAPGSGPVHAVRMIKDAQELEKLRKSSLIADEVMRLAIERVASGATETEMLDFIEAQFKARGCETMGTQIAAYGAGAAEPHHTCLNVALKEGEAVLFDIFGKHDGYWSDSSRTVFYKSVDERSRSVYEAVLQAQLAAEAAVRPGVRMSEVEAASRKVLNDAGFPTEPGRIGHGVGSDVHEQPVCTSANDVILQPGMVFTIEPGIYLKGEIGVRIEDIVVVTETGAEILNKNPKELMIVG